MVDDPIIKVEKSRIEHVFACLRHIDQARRDLAAKGPGNEAIVEELRKSSDGIYHTLNGLPELEDE